MSDAHGGASNCAAALLAEYVHLHNEVVRSRGDARVDAAEALGALFADDAEFGFRGRDVPGATGRAAIVAMMRDRPPKDTLVPWRIAAWSRRRANSIYAWSAAPDLAEGTIRIESRVGDDADGGDDSGDDREVIASLLVCFRGGPPAPPTPRRAARVILRAPGDVAGGPPRYLLIRVTEPVSGVDWWITPGGGIDPGEDPRRAACRELHEETGLVADTLGPHLWTSERVWQWNTDIVRQHETTFLHDVSAPFTPAPALDPALLAKECIATYRWWTLAEITAAVDEAFPPGLADRLADLERSGPPATPRDLRT